MALWMSAQAIFAMVPWQWYSEENMLKTLQ